jgi:hypothetical protein
VVRAEGSRHILDILIAITYSFKKVINVAKWGTPKKYLEKKNP